MNGLGKLLPPEAVLHQCILEEKGNRPMRSRRRTSESAEMSCRIDTTLIDA
jgi:hypothetical protein